MSRPLLALLCFAATTWPGAASACAVCFNATEDNRWAFIGTTAFLTLLPLAMIGGTLFWLRRRHLAVLQGPPEAAGES